MVPGLSSLEYPERLKSLGLPSLYYRRARGDIIEAYKYIKGIYNVQSVPLLLDENSRTRGNQLKLRGGNFRTDCRKFFFSERVVNLWNSLPDSVVDAPSVNALKSRLDLYWHDKRFIQEIM